MRFIRDVLAVAFGVCLGFTIVVHTHELIDVVYAIAEIYELNAPNDTLRGR